MEVFEANEQTPQEAEQLELLEAPGLARRGPGRPPGTLNRRTEQWVKLILARYASPLVALAETYHRPVQELARELGCTKLEAFQEQQKAAIALAPYLHQKLPLALHIEGKGVVPVVLVPLDQQGESYDGNSDGGGLQIGVIMQGQDAPDGGEGQGGPP
jgi:hypothetical protein